MDTCIAEWEFLDTKLKSMNSGLEENMLTTMFFESFGGNESKWYENFIAALQTKDICRWSDVKARMLQEYASKSNKNGK